LPSFAGTAMMIARVWKATVDVSEVDAYVRHFAEHVAPALARVDGYQGSQVLCNRDAHPTDLVVVTWWNSLDAIRGFAGDDIGRAVIDSEARQVLLSCDDRVTHYTVIADHRSR
jgi:heme-degrading monooxygenase HmoA